MRKEDLIKLIESLIIEEITGFTLVYFDKEKDRFSTNDRELRNISYGYDVKKALENLRFDMDRSREYLNREVIQIIEEKLNERGNK